MYVSQCRDKTNIFCDVCFRHDNMFSASWCFTPHWRRIRLKSKIHHKQHQTQQTNNKTLGYAVIIIFHQRYSNKTYHGNTLLHLPFQRNLSTRFAIFFPNRLH